MERDAHGIVNACSTCHLRAAGSSSTTGWNAGWMRASTSRVHPYALSTGEGTSRFVIAAVEFSLAPFPPSNNHSPSECEQRFAQFIIDLHADSSYIIRPRFLGLERSQRHQENEDGCCWDGVLYGEAFNRNSILSCGVLLDLVARCSSVVMNAMLVLCYVVLRYCFQSIGSNVGDTLEFVRIFKFFDLI